MVSELIRGFLARAMQAWMSLEEAMCLAIPSSIPGLLASFRRTFVDTSLAS